MSKKESLEEFIARGGKIAKLPTQYKEEIVRRARPAPQTVAIPLTLDEAEVLYGHDGSARPEGKDPRTKSRLDLSALPEELKKKFISKLNRKIESDNE